ncbi:hypothetical protein FXO37_10825 [Capsicum annuum]|nr:hypothetical protein FXO37_10825 [Capsicum annuum]
MWSIYKLTMDVLFRVHNLYVRTNTSTFVQISEMEIGLAVGGAFLSSTLGVLFDRLAPQDAVDGAENSMEQVNYEALRLKMEGQLRNLAETSNQQVSDLNLSLSDDFFLNIKEILEDTIETLVDLQKQIGLIGLKEHFG